MNRKPRDKRIPTRDEREKQTVRADSTPAESPHALPDGRIEGVDREFELVMRHIFAKHGGAFKRLAE